MIDFTNKTTVITGGSSGMGLETARRILQAGGNVVITGRTLSTLEEARSSLIQTDADAANRLMIAESDTSDLDSVVNTLEATQAQFGRLDNVFANAGIGIFKPLSDLTVEDFDKLININLKGLFFTIQKAAPMMNDGGAILMTSSWTAHRGVAGAHLYSATKAALLSLA
ncbi:MAG: SDR family NAD(P)-dependent oxidoreductase, partial [Cyanobacteria bacterium P01_D01_bin.115]